MGEYGHFLGLYSGTFISILRPWFHLLAMNESNEIFSGAIFHNFPSTFLKDFHNLQKNGYRW